MTLRQLLTEHFTMAKLNVEGFTLKLEDKRPTSEIDIQLHLIWVHYPMFPVSSSM